MTTITTILSTDYPKDSRAVINTNFTNLNTDKAETASPTFTGTPVAPTASAGTNTTQIATTAFVANAVGTVEQTTGTTHSLTTTSGQKVIVWVKGTYIGGAAVVTTKYNGVQKDLITFSGSNNNGAIYPFSMFYTEIPGAATANIVVATTAGTIAEVVILVMKI